MCLDRTVWLRRRRAFSPSRERKKDDEGKRRQRPGVNARHRVWIFHLRVASNNAKMRRRRCEAKTGDNNRHASKINQLQKKVAGTAVLSVPATQKARFRPTPRGIRLGTSGNNWKTALARSGDEKEMKRKGKEKGGRVLCALWCCGAVARGAVVAEFICTKVVQFGAATVAVSVADIHAKRQFDWLRGTVLFTGGTRGASDRGRRGAW